MHILFRLHPQKYSGIEKEQGLSMEEECVWLNAEKFHMAGTFGKVDVQKIAGISSGGIQLFLLSYKILSEYQLVLKALSHTVLMVLQLKGESYFTLDGRFTFRLKPCRYHILSVPVKKVLLDIAGNVEGKLILIALKPDYFNDMALYYPAARKFLKQRRTLLRYPGQAEGILTDRQMQGVLRFILDHLQNSPQVDFFTLGLAVKTFISLALTARHLQSVRQQFNEHNQQIAAIAQSLLENTDEFPGIKKLSRMAHLNTTTFKKLFVQQTGMPPEQFWNRNRLRIAYDMLCTQNKRPSEVADILGYASLHNFDRAFKKHFGVTPSTLSRDGK